MWTVTTYFHKFVCGNWIRSIGYFERTLDATYNSIYNSKSKRVQNFRFLYKFLFDLN